MKREKIVVVNRSSTPHHTRVDRDPRMQCIRRLSSLISFRARNIRRALLMRKTRQTRRKETLFAEFAEPMKARTRSQEEVSTMIASKTFHAASSLTKKYRRC